MEELNLKEILYILLNKWWILVISIIIVFSACYVWTNYYVTPEYSSATTLYVGKNVDQVGIQTTDLNMGTSLIDDYREIAKSKLIAYEVIEKLDLTNMDADTLTSKISVSQRGETRVIQISVTDTDPNLAMEITKTVAEVFREKVIEIMQIENVQIIDKAKMPMHPVSPNKNRNYLMSIILGMALGIGLVFLLHFMDDNVKTPEDVEKCVDLPVIGTIPVFGAKGGRGSNG